jgi:pimeloyl-ACP methyl ester carboxylesterase
MDKNTIDAYDLKYRDVQRIATSDGAQLYWEKNGDHGPPLVIVNNFFVISPLWRSFTTSLVKNNQIYSYDLRNQAASSPAEGKLKFESHIDDLKALVDELKLERVYLLGTSTSTLIVRDFCIKYPERVKGLVLVGPLFCPYGSRRRKYLTKSWLNSVEKGGTETLFGHIYPLIYGDRTIETGGAPAFLALRERFMALNSVVQVRINLNASLTTDDDPSKLKKILAPTLLLAGEADFISCRSSLEAAARLVPKCDVEILEFSGHVPYFEATAAFESAVQHFIDRVEGT